MTDPVMFTKDARVSRAVAEVKRACAGRVFSDVVDAAGHQYVDVVMEGGGVLGIALTGYTYALEQAGIRFLGIGGTSAGSINALVLAALGTPAEAKSEKLLAELAAMPMAAFIDGDSDARDFSEAILEKARMSKLLWKAGQIVDNLKEDLGLNPGKAFFDWLTAVLRRAGIRTTADLQAKLSTMPEGLRLRQGVRDGKPLSQSESCGRHGMIAADITTETKVEFPRMAKLYWADPDSVNPACFARASMSIPVFFHPFTVEECPQGPAAKAAWHDEAGYDGELPKRALFIDGGIMSNFPINLFHEPFQVPTAPTFGAKIGIDRGKPADISKPAQLMGAIFDAARHTLDYDFIMQNPDYRQLVTMIDTGEHNWLNFSMEDGDKVDLFARGAEAACGFLCSFNWEQYKEVRRDLAAAFKATVGQ